MRSRRPFLVVGSIPGARACCEPTPPNPLPSNGGGADRRSRIPAAAPTYRRCSGIPLPLPHPASAPAHIANAPTYRRSSHTPPSLPQSTTAAQLSSAQPSSGQLSLARLFAAQLHSPHRCSVCQPSPSRAPSAAATPACRLRSGMPPLPATLPHTTAATAYHRRSRTQLPPPHTAVAPAHHHRSRILPPLPHTATAPAYHHRPRIPHSKDTHTTKLGTNVGSLNWTLTLGFNAKVEH